MFEKVMVMNGEVEGVVGGEGEEVKKGGEGGEINGGEKKDRRGKR